MRSVPVVVVEPARQMLGAIGCGSKGSAIGPFAQGGLNEAFGLAIGLGSIGLSLNVFNAELPAGFGKELGAETGAVVGHESLHPHTKVLIVGQSLAQESRGTDISLEFCLFYMLWIEIAAMRGSR